MLEIRVNNIKTLVAPGVTVIEACKQVGVEIELDKAQYLRVVIDDEDPRRCGCHELMVHLTMTPYNVKRFRFRDIFLSKRRARRNTTVI